MRRLWRGTSVTASELGVSEAVHAVKAEASMASAKRWSPLYRKTFYNW